MPKDYRRALLELKAEARGTPPHGRRGVTTGFVIAAMGSNGPAS